MKFKLTPSSPLHTFFWPPAHSIQHFTKFNNKLGGSTAPSYIHFWGPPAHPYDLDLDLEIIYSVILKILQAIFIKDTLETLEVIISAA